MFYIVILFEECNMISIHLRLVSWETRQIGDLSFDTTARKRMSPQSVPFAKFEPVFYIRKQKLPALIILKTQPWDDVIFQDKGAH